MAFAAPGELTSNQHIVCVCSLPTAYIRVEAVNMEVGVAKSHVGITVMTV